MKIKPIILVAFISALHMSCKKTSIEEKVNQIPLKSDHAFCIYYEGANVVSPNLSYPFYQVVPGNRIVFVLGHMYSMGSESGGIRYLFELDPIAKHHGIDSSESKKTKVYIENGGMAFLETKIESGKIFSGKQISDSIWQIYEWFSEDYHELRRRNQYRNLNKRNVASGGYERQCKEVRFH